MSDADLEARIAAARTVIREILIAGGNTAAARATLSALERERRCEVTSAGNAQGEARRAADEEIARAGTAIANVAMRNLSNRLAALQIPVMPKLEHNT